MTRPHGAPKPKRPARRFRSVEVEPAAASRARIKALQEREKVEPTGVAGPASFARARALRLHGRSS